MWDSVLNDLKNFENTNPIVVMTCGVAGSGKTTFAQELEKFGFIRLSIDEEIWATHGRYGIDYPVEKYDPHGQKAEFKLRNQLIDLIRDEQKVVVDFSFWQRSRRDEYKQLIEQNGGLWKLVYLKVSPEVLRQRLEVRSQRFDANAAFMITKNILTRYLNGFEVPLGEGEIVVENEILITQNLTEVPRE
jgi:predicted kinase